MKKLTRRATLGALAATPLAAPALVRAATVSKTVKIGLVSDMNGPYRTVGGPGSKIATELAIQDFGGTVLGRKIEILQADDQNKPNVASALARQWIAEDHVDVLGDGSATSSGLGVLCLGRARRRGGDGAQPGRPGRLSRCTPALRHYGAPVVRHFGITGHRWYGDMVVARDPALRPRGAGRQSAATTPHDGRGHRRRHWPEGRRG